MVRLVDGPDRCISAGAQYSDFRLGLRGLLDLESLLDSLRFEAEVVGAADHAGRFHGKQCAWDCALALSEGEGG